MTLLTAAIAAVIVTLVWYFKDGTNEMRIGTLSLMYWGRHTDVAGRCDS